MRCWIIFFCLLINTTIFGQDPDIKINNPYKQSNKKYLPSGDVNSDDPSKSEINAATVDGVIEGLFELMYQGQGESMKELFAADARLSTTTTDPQGNHVLRTITVEELTKSISGAEPGSLDERISIRDILIDDQLASAWVDYEFYLNGKFSHCGVDAFQLFNENGKWKIFQISDTRRTSNCNKSEQHIIDQLLDDWHLNAANAKSGPYFDFIAEDGYFLGTDPNESWTKEDFYQFAKPFFDKGKAWDFKPEDRKIFLSDDKQFAWFQESLETWMGACRGSGVLTKDQDKWKLKQYNLAILVPNDLVNSYLDLLKKS